MVANGRLEASKADILKETPGAALALVTLDLNSLASVRAAAKEIAAHGPIDVLINNAAVMMCPYSTTADGLETQLGTNYVAPWLLTNRLLPALLASASPRVVFVSSVGHRASDIRWDDMGFAGGKAYNNVLAYGQSKTAAILNAVALAARYPQLTAIALHPGAIQTNLGRHLTEEDMKGFAASFFNEDGSPKDGVHFKSIPAGASTTLVAAFDPAMKRQSGRYLADCQVATEKAAGADPFENLTAVGTVAPYALDKAAAERLWKVTEEMAGETFA
jgi:NAD(P)-dependent dehydrogenase (short-subunit alcohol dehydrogenase family)